MEEIEVPLEQVHEHIHEAVHGEGGHGGHEGLMSRAAILSAVLAVLAAISALFAGHYANDAMIEQIKSSDQWALYQSKGIKKAIAELRQATVEGTNAAAVEKYKQDQEHVKEEAELEERKSEMHLQKHETLAASVTFFQVAIGLTAVGILSRKKRFLVGAMALGGLGIAAMLWGFLVVGH